MARRCEQCDIKVPAYRPRRRAADGRLLCDGCHPDGKGGEGRPVGYHGSRTAKNETCVLCGEFIEPDQLVLDGEGWPQPMHRSCADNIDLYANLRTVAHDSGDGETIYHCPFCGGGQVTGRSDGTAECDFCQTAFTVQVQPKQTGQPQTNPLTGEPLDMPGMPGDPNAPAETPPGQEAAPGEPPQPAGQPADINAEFSVLLGEGGAGGQQVAAGRYYLGADGLPRDEDTFVRHLAVLHAEDRDAVLSTLRAEKSRGGGSRTR